MKSPIAAPAVALVVAGSIIAATASFAPAEAARSTDGASIERGRYLARVAGCNDCHTPGYAQSGGTTPESQWLTGDQLGWKGPWGTTYPANLRLVLDKVSEDDWVKRAKTAQYRPPMPWFALRDMSEADLRALHRFVRSLPVTGEPAPAYVPPGVAPNGPVVSFPEPPAAKTAAQ